MVTNNMATVTNRLVLSAEGKVKVIRQIENGKKKGDMYGELSRKLYDPNDSEK
jgi:hypothetical protein